MPTVVLCEDGIEVALEKDEGLWIVLRNKEKESLGRFTIDPSELRAAISGRLSYNATDGSGSSVSIDGTQGALKIRLEGKGFAPKNCRLNADEVEAAVKSLNLGV